MEIGYTRPQAQENITNCINKQYTHTSANNDELQESKLTDNTTPNPPDSVEIAQKEEYIEIPDGASAEYEAQPKRKYGEKTIKGIIVGRGDNRQIINLEDVKKLAALHLTYKDMANYFGCKENTFRDNFRTVVERARQQTKQRLMEAMLESAIVKQNPTILVWTSKNLLNWTDNPVNTDSSQVLPWQSDETE